MFLKIISQAFETEDFLNISLPILGFWGPFSYKHFSKKTCVKLKYKRGWLKRMNGNNQGVFQLLLVWYFRFKMAEMQLT